MQFYHYVHCPFCQRVRLALEFKNIKYEDIVLSYANKETPESLIGAKLLPIINFGMVDGKEKIMGESLDQVIELGKDYDADHSLFPKNINIELAKIASLVPGIPRYFDLVLPWILDAYKDSLEFDVVGAEYFKTGKEAKRGKTFADLKLESVDIFENNVIPVLEKIERLVESGFVYDIFSAADCVLVADLSPLRCVEGITIPQNIADYIERVEKICGVDLMKN